MRIESQIATGEFFSSDFPQERRPFKLYQVNPTTLEVRFDDGASPMIVSPDRMELEAVKRALMHAVEEDVCIDGDRLDIPFALAPAA